MISFTILFYSTTGQASIVVTTGLGLESLETKELSREKGKASGTYSSIKIGLLQGNTEIGVYSSRMHSKVTLKHDAVNNDLSYEINSVGAYLAFYKNSMYFEFGYGKASVLETLESPLSGTSLTTLVDIYNIKDGNDFPSSEARALAGLKVLNFSVFVLSIYAQKIKMLESSHDQTSLGIELKINI